jgi:cation:H+ antiporter
MSLIFNSLILIALFTILGLAADIVVNNVRSIATALKLKLFALGIVLGIFTTLPELSVGINASLEGAGSISVGNIMGGVIVLIGLILGTSLILNKKIGTEETLKMLFPASLVILSPFLFGIDGKLGIIDGLSMITLYVGLIFYLYHINRDRRMDSGLVVVDKGKIGKSIVLAIFGVIIVMLSSHWIVEITLDLLDKIQISELFIGLILFSLGTNLPEISITLTAWRKKNSELSLSHLVSSAFTNILILGFLTVLKPITFSTDIIYYVLVFFVFLIILLLFIFAKSDKSLSRREGGILFLIYVIFIIVNIILA